MMIGFGARTIPTRIKLFLCVTLTLAIMPAIPPTKVDQLLSYARHVLQRGA